MAIPIVPILLAIPHAAEAIRAIFGDSQRVDKADVERILRVAEERLAAMQADRMQIEHALRAAEARLVPMQADRDRLQADLLQAEHALGAAEAKLAAMQADRDRLLGELEKAKGCKWPRCWIPGFKG